MDKNESCVYPEIFVSFRRITLYTTRMNFKQAIPLSLYIHLPWCLQKCPYCDFNSHAVQGELPETAYIDALLADLDSNLPHIWGRRLSSIFFGGGTPSLFSPKSLKRLLQAIHARLPFHPELEITLEANPGTVEQKRFEGFRAAGINRLSLGIQSFDPSQLKKLGRIHDEKEAVRAIKSATLAGFDNFNIDIMFGLNQQTQSEALADLQQALDLNPTHLSWYQLTIEPNTVFHKTQPLLPKDDAIIEMQQAGQALLAKNGLKQYEVSAYAKNDLQCQHNLNYWEFGDYLGIGAGAHSKITDPSQQKAFRQWNVRQPKDYLHKDKAFIAKKAEITDEAIAFEFMLNALRLKDGVSTDLFEARSGLDFDSIRKIVKKLQADGLLKQNDTFIKTTDLGFLHLNTLLMAFML